MDTINVILSRRSHRQYLKKDVDEKTLNLLLECGLRASFGGPPKPKCQVTEFVVIRDSDLRAKLAMAYDDRQFIKESPLLIACCANTKNDPQYNEWLLSASLSIQNIVIAAESLGLGCCILSCFINHDAHIHDKQILRNALKLTDGVELVALVSIGYKDESEVLPEKTYRSKDEVIFSNYYDCTNE